ncbi:TPA: type 2 lantipeptide synthetase LanM family protein [Streptococcus suis]|nr:type 2 lantipeptide synthetase LanM family protein [Streptococcus suis]
MVGSEILYNQFNTFQKVVLERYFPELLLEDGDIIDEIGKKILDYYRPTLIYLINEKRIEGSLVGSTPEIRYDFFNNVLCRKGIILDEIEQRFPEINHRVVLGIQKYLSLVEFVKNTFISDFSELVAKKYINSTCVTPNISDIKLNVTGDIHNGDGVCIVSYRGQKVVLKKKSAKPNILLARLDSRVSAYLDKEIHFIPSFLNKGNYFWEKFVISKPINSKNEAEEFYRRIGYLLGYSYILNISDLHFENLISSNLTPILVDVETIFSISPFDTLVSNKATFHIIEKSRDSVLSTGLLPIADSDDVFGGDTSGVLGGTFFGEVKVVVNHNRDDIRIEKKKYQIKNQEHLPYFLNSGGEKHYLNAVEYIEFIKEGFRELGNFFVKEKQYLKNLYLNHSDIQTRILFRNTKDYSLIRQLLISPVYCDKSKVLFEKMSNKLNEYDCDMLIQSEKNQLLNMDIPYFSTSINSCDITDGERKIWKLKISALNTALKKLERLSDELIEEQIDLIEFSLKTTQALYSTELQEEYRKYDCTSVDDGILNEGINALVDIILDDEKYSLEDDSTNWLTLKVNDHDAFELVPMDNSVYEGIAGMAIALSEAYDLVDPSRQERIMDCLKRILSTLLNLYTKIENPTYFVGKLGVFSAISRISLITGQRLPDDIFKIRDQYCLNLNTSQADFLSSFPNEIVAFRNTDTNIENLAQSLVKLKELGVNNNDYICWNRLEANNVSLAHGNLGVEVALLFLAYKSNRSEALDLFNKARTFENQQKLGEGWIDKRNGETSANWCHGSTGVLVARLAQLQLNDKYNILSDSEVEELRRDVEHAVKQIIEIGFDMTNFSLCHGTSGNLLALSYYLNYMENCQSKKLKGIVDREYKKLHSFGLEKGWMCSFNTKYNVYGLMTGIPGILFSTAKYLKEDKSLDILIPSV